MPGPENKVYIIYGEMNMVVTAIKRSGRWSSHTHQEDEREGLLKEFGDLKEILNKLNNVNDLEPIVYLTPFLDVIRSETTTGPVTALGLSAVSKFLSYGLIDTKNGAAAVAAENIADAVTHARFVGTDSSSDEVVLMKIIQVLRLLFLTPLGTLLTNESVCEIMQSCFRICFEIRLTELLRRTAENALMDMVQLLFSCLPQFTEDLRSTHKKLKMRSGMIDAGYSHRKKRSSRAKHRHISKPDGDTSSTEKLITVPHLQSLTSENTGNSINNNSSVPTIKDCTANDVEVTTTDDLTENLNSEDVAIGLDDEHRKNDISKVSVDLSLQLSSGDNGFKEEMETDQKNTVNAQPYTLDLKCMRRDSDTSDVASMSCNDTQGQNKSSESVDASSESGSITADMPDDSFAVDPSDTDYVNPRGVRFTPHQPLKEGSFPLIPYGLPCVRELFRYLVCLINPLDRHNTDTMVQIGLSLLTVALEAGADNIGKFGSLLLLIKDETCRNLFSLLSTDRLTVFASTLRVCFLLFEALRTHLKFQLEMFLTTLMEIIISESSKISYEQREMSLECVTQLWRIPGMVTELYINYDCDLYCSNLFEDLTKLLSKNAFPLSGLYSVHLLSLDALLAVIDTIENHCHCRMMNEARYLKEEFGGNDKAKLDMNSESADICILQQGASGYLLGQQLLDNERADKPVLSCIESQFSPHPRIQPNRMKVSTNIPSHEELMAIKHKKKILVTGTEQFNNQPSKGILFLQEHGLLKDPLDPQEVAAFLRDNPQLDKKMIGEYISNRKNLKVLEAFVRSFSFENTRIDEALRQYLETFRLPGEAPLISLIMEHFAEHWHKSNNEPFANNDAAFTLAYAVIMLNVDQHNHNVKKQNNPMTLEDFKKNLKDVNGGKDFDDNMLEEIYTSIKNEEIVMPAEQTGIVRENYLWKVLLRRGNSKDGKFIHTPSGLFDHDLFSLSWGPTVAALSFIFDKSNESNIIEKTISGFQKCAVIAAHYGMSDVFDNLVISLCKFTTLVNSTENPKTVPISFGNNAKAQMATKAVFRLAHRHGDILREGWKNLLDCVLQLYKARLLPKEMVEAEDFVNSKGVISLIREDVPTIPRIESGLLSSFYSYITLTSDSPAQRPLTQEDEAAKRAAIECISSCHCEHLFTESKFLRVESLQELTKTLIFACHGPEINASQGNCFDEDSAVFLLEILVRIVLLNRDRVVSIWSDVQDHLFSLIMGAAATDKTFLLERSVVGILRIAIRLVRKEEMIPQVIQSLQVLLFLKPVSLALVSRQIAFALHELLRTNAANIHSKIHWSIIFSLMERVGAGAKPQRSLSAVNAEIPSKLAEAIKHTGAQSDSEVNTGRQMQDSGFISERGYTSDSELYESQTSSPRHQNSPQKMVLLPESANSCQGGWILVTKTKGTGSSNQYSLHMNQYSISLDCEMLPHDSLAFLKCCESLAFLVRDAAHITAENFESCVHCIRIFIEASSNGGHSFEKKSSKPKVNKERKWSKGSNQKRRDDKIRKSRSQVSKSADDYDADDEDKMFELSPAYQQVSMQLLDLMHTLHTRASSIYSNQSDLEIESTEKFNPLWSNCWCPLLQGIARLCCDTRRAIRTSALTLLPRALLVHDLQALSAVEWEACFNKVLFPLLAKLLENISPDDPLGMEETRMRGATLLCKVFLQHLSPLLTLPTFMALWLTILDFMDKYMHADGSGLLAEAIPESLKNMLLVMDTAGIFHRPDDSNTSEECQMWDITWDRINAFLPNLKDELFKSPVTSSNVSAVSKSSTEIATEQETSHHTVEILSSNLSEYRDTTEDNQDSVFTEVSTSLTTAALNQVNTEVTGHTASTVSVILHPPASPLIYTTISTPGYPNCLTLSSASTNTVTTPAAVPILLNPSVMNQAHMNIFTPQVTPCSVTETPR